MLHLDVPTDCIKSTSPSMPLANYLRRRGATYSVRVPVPRDLWVMTGKREIVKALGKVRDPAEAKQKGAEKAREIHAGFERLRSGAIVEVANYLALGDTKCCRRSWISAPWLALTETPKWLSGVVR